VLRHVEQPQHLLVDRQKDPATRAGRGQDECQRGEADEHVTKEVARSAGGAGQEQRR
jgi:hypothetical protein